jgi:hypothetical protein
MVFPCIEWRNTALNGNANSGELRICARLSSTRRRAKTARIDFGARGEEECSGQA